MRHFAAVLGLLIAAVPPTGAGAETHVAVIDAGSSGSRLHLYRLGNDEQTIEDRLEIAGSAPPLAAQDPANASAADKAIGALLARLDLELGRLGVLKTDVAVHVLATGGMRLLPQQSRETIEASVSRTLLEGGYRPGRIETISGEMEGFYAWLDVNVLRGFLQPGRSPAGIIEVGGASMQVAYSGAPPGAPDVVTAAFGGATWSVRSISFLGLGIEQARKSLMTGADAKFCFPPGLKVEETQGAFDAERCVKALEDVVAGPTRAFPRGEAGGRPFVGLGRPLAGVLADWRLPLDRTDDISRAAREACGRPWPDFARAQGDTQFTPYLCVNSLYLATLLFDDAGFGLPRGSVAAVDRIAGRRPSWTRGAALMLRDRR